MENIIIFLLTLSVIIVALIWLSYVLKNKKEIKKPQEEWVARHLAKAKKYAETHKKETRVIAKSKDGTWKEGIIIGEHDWSLFTFYFMIKFDDGEIIKQSEGNVNKIS